MAREFTFGRGARDRLLDTDEGDGASGAALPFDGNRTDDPECWLIANEAWDVETFEAETLPKLMYYTAMGHLSWVLIPPKGFYL